MELKEKKSAVELLKELGYLEYDKTIPTDIMLSAVGIEEPVGKVDRTDITKFQFELLSKISILRSELLEHNMFLNTERGVYRILRPNEHCKKADQYYLRAMNEFDKSKKVLEGTDTSSLNNEELTLRNQKLEIVNRTITQTNRLKMDLFKLKEAI